MTRIAPKGNARLRAAVLASVFLSLGPYRVAGAQPHHEEAPSLSPAAALQRLVEGNSRFAAGTPSRPHQSSDYRKQLVPGQHPIATVFGCGDSRVPSELVFDQGFGDLFVVRVAGNVGGADDLGSIEYAVIHLHTPLVLVLGHESCGAVTAALSADTTRAHEAGGIQDMLAHVVPSLAGVDRALPMPEQVHQGVEANVRRSVELLRATPELKPRLASGSLDIVGAVYDLGTGKVRLLK
jgi:carbonic anhydrase